MANSKRKHSALFKAKVALAAIKAETTQNQITSQYEVHATQLKRWRQQALEAIADCFTKKRERTQASQDELVEKLYAEVGRLQTQLNWLKKKCGADD